MPLEVEIIRATEFIRIGAQGQFDLAASKAALARVAAACRKRGIDNAVLDLRMVRPGPKPVFTSADLLDLVNTFPSAGFTKRLRLAVLYRCDPHKRARLFAFVSTLHGWNVRAFGDFEHALIWLSTDQESDTQPDHAFAGKRIPIKNRNQDSGKPAQAAHPQASQGGPPSGQKRAGFATGHTRTGRVRGQCGGNQPPLSRQR